MTDSGVVFSLVIPAYNEEGSLRLLHDELLEVLPQLEGGYEIIFVDDGSTDATSQVIETLMGDSPHVRGLRLTRNAGKSAAYIVGFEAARGRYVFTLDADLQDDPAELPNLLAKLHEGFDLVVGWKTGRLSNEPSKAMPSRLYNSVKGILFGLKLHDSNCGFRVMHAAVAKSLDLYGDQYRFLPELADHQGFRVTEVPVHHRPRQHGVSKYGPRRFWTGLLDLFAIRFVTAFTHKPMHFFGTAGLLALLIGVGLLVYALICKLLGDLFREHIAAILIGVMMVILGTQAFGTGLLAELITANRTDRKRHHVETLQPGSGAAVANAPATAVAADRDRVSAEAGQA